MKAILSLALLPVCLGVSAQTDAYLKIHDSHGRHPRAVSIEFPGDTPFPADYDAIYGHGAVLENPFLAIRVYMDNRQSVDLYLKQTPRLELDHTGFYSTKEQVDSGYGCDVLFAGQSVGMGSFRGYEDGKPTLIENPETRKQTVIDDHTIQIHDKNWMHNGHPIQMTQTYTARPDAREIDVEVQLEGYQPDDLFCTGVQKIETANEGFIDPKGVAGSWGVNVPDKSQEEWTETIGLGIKICPCCLVEAKEDDLNYLFILKPNKEGKIRYTITATGLREKEGFKSANEWFEYLKK